MRMQAPRHARRLHGALCRFVTELALCHQIGDRKQNNDRNSADQQHFVAGDRPTRLGRTFHYFIVFDLRHSSTSFERP